MGSFKLVFSHLLADRLHQFSKFLLVGVVNTLIDVSILNLLMFVSGIYYGAYLILFNTISYSVAIINSYIFNKKWTFQDKSKARTNQFCVFVAIALIGMGLNNAIIYVIITYASPAFGFGWVMWVNFAKIMGVGVVTMWNFLGYKIFVFNLTFEK